jgi:hypothetical protein
MQIQMTDLDEKIIVTYLSLQSSQTASRLMISSHMNWRSAERSRPRTFTCVGRLKLLLGFVPAIIDLESSLQFFKG